MKQERISKILLKLQFSEKANRTAEDHNQYVFCVIKDANKLEIKKAVEQFFTVTVKSVRTVLMKGKTKRNKFGKGQCSNFKKAYVSLEQGQEIDLSERNEEKSE